MSRLRLLVTVCRQDDSNDDYEREEVPSNGDFAQFIEQMGPIDVHCHSNHGHEVGYQDNLPALNHKVWMGQVHLAQDEIRANEIVRSSHCKNA